MSLLRAVTGAAIALTAATASPDQQPVVRPTTHGVRLHVIATEHGRPVSGLTREDFEVTDSGVKQDIQSATTIGRVSVAVVIDASLSVRRPSYATSIGRAEDVVRLLHPDEEAAVVAFSDRVTVLTPATRDRAALVNVFDRARALGPGAIMRSTVWDGVMAGAALLRPSDAVPWVVWLSDGMDNASGLSRVELEEAMSAMGVVVDFVQLEWDEASYDQFPPGLQEPELLATRSGGSVHRAQDRRLSENLAARLADLRQAYVITYQPKGITHTNPWHPVRVRVPGRAVSIRARPGYFER